MLLIEIVKIVNFGGVNLKRWLELSLLIGDSNGKNSGDVVVVVVVVGR